MAFACTRSSLATRGQANSGSGRELSTCASGMAESRTVNLGWHRSRVRPVALAGSLVTVPLVANGLHVERRRYEDASRKRAASFPIRERPEPEEREVREGEVNRRP